MTYLVAPEAAGQRLDHFLQTQLPEYSRSRLQQWTKEGRAIVNGVAQKPSYIVRAGETVDFETGELPSLRAFAEDLPVDVLYLDDDVIVVNKPAGVVVHAGAGNHSGTLVNALLHRFQTLSNVSGEDRPGIVHRIDRETSGVLVVARTDAAHRALAEQFASREVEKIYLALVEGPTGPSEGKVDARIARDPIRRIRMTTGLEHGRTAITYYRVLERLPKHLFLEVRIGTGRTHQIRVHMASIGHPIAGDTLYGAKAAPYGRFFLHAHRLTFHSPSTGKPVTVEAPLPPELEAWLASCR